MALGGYPKRKGTPVEHDPSGKFDIPDENVVSLQRRGLWFGPREVLQAAYGGFGDDDDEYTKEDDKKVKIPDQPFEDDPKGGGGGGGAGGPNSTMGDTAGPEYLQYLRTPRPGRPAQGDSPAGYGNIIRYNTPVDQIMRWQQPVFGHRQAQQQGLLGPGMGSPMSYEDYLSLSGLLSPLGANTII